MKKSVFLGAFVTGILLFGSCGGNKQQQYVEEESDSISKQELESRDRTIYGICASGTAMNTLEIITDSGDTLKMSITHAKEKGKVFGGLGVSDRLAVLPDSTGILSTEVQRWVSASRKVVSLRVSTRV